MPQLSVYRNPRPGSSRHAPYLLEVQSDLVQTGLRVVIPLVVPDYFGPAAKTLNPVLTVEGADYVLSPAEIGSLPRKQLGTPVAHLLDQRQEIMAAVDFVFYGI